MSLWSKSGDKPKHLTSTEKRTVIATDKGWVNRKVYTDKDGNVRTKDEILVNITGLAAESTMGNPFVTSIYAANSSGGSTIKTNSATTIKVVYSEPVSVKAAATALVFNLRN